MASLSDNLNARQVEAVIHKDGPMLVLAGAGSGKTTVLIARVERLIERRSSMEHSYHHVHQQGRR